ncbi:MAG TPA: NAD(P)/FAD-dependent oxidoreductase [Aquihabitans sp.]|nr:NAD(P)/FAD-dependent oxidoreductase [Aquihabitans sp.]
MTGANGANGATAPDATAGVEHVDVLVIGAGLSGIGVAHHLQERCPWAEVAIFEARDAIGGTWDLFRYPGLRSDSDMYTLGYAFRPWTGERSIATGDSILQYIRDTAAEDGTDRRIRFHHRIVWAEWRTDEARWHVTAERTDTGEAVSITCGFLFSCTGYYRYDHGYQPEFPGVDRYQGTMIHPQDWPEDLDPTGRRVVVIGSGATAVTLVPALAETAEHVTMLQRSPTYIIAVPARSPVGRLLHKVLPTRWAGAAARWFQALLTQGSYRLSRRRPELVKKALRKGLERQLPDGYDIDTHFTPAYDPWDQRLCAVPDGDLFEAISVGTASVVTDRIETFTERGIQLRSGDELEADVVVSATGLELLFLGGIEVVVDGEPVDLASRIAYKGMMLEGVPNLAIAIGYTNASWTLKVDLIAEHVCRILGLMRERGLRQCTPVNRDTSVSTAPLLGLASGYVQRSADRFPKQGSHDPWQLHQSYLRDYRALRSSGVEDPALELSNPTPTAHPGTSVAPPAEPVAAAD